ncbi:MAG: hypothetical protein AAB931_00365, partial [Patescibacteria group bacterium]
CSTMENSKVSNTGAVILLKLGEENKVYSEGECIVIEGKNTDGLIKSGEKLEFSETMPSYDSSDWWSSNIVDAQYYNGEYVPTPASTVFPTPTVIIPPFIAMTPTPMPTQIPTPTPNLNKIFALKMLNERIIQITQEINFHNSVIKSLIDEEGERCDRPLSILKDGQIENPQVLIQCFNDYSSRIKEEQAKRDALIRERNAFEREAAQIIAQ